MRNGLTGETHWEPGKPGKQPSKEVVSAEISAQPDSMDIGSKQPLNSLDSDIGQPWAMGGRTIPAFLGSSWSLEKGYTYAYSSQLAAARGPSEGTPGENIPVSTALPISEQFTYGLLPKEQHHGTSLVVQGLRLKVVKSVQCLTLCDPWTVARQAPLSMGISRQEYWSGLPFPPQCREHEFHLWSGN